jgi:small subunit ribosomal protein S3
MGHKVNPKIFRIKNIHTWNSKWFAGHSFPSQLREDVTIRRFLEKKLKEASVDRVTIDRSTDSLEITIYTARPGVVIGKGGAGIEDLKKYIAQKILKYKKVKINLNIKEISRPNLSARIIAQNVAIDLEKRMPFRRVMKKYIESSMKAGAEGIKIVVSGRLGGAEIARREKLSEGKIPLHTIRADIDYARLAAFTSFGAIGVKVWICKGEVFKPKNDEK